MFTGIIETLAEVVDIREEGTNKNLTLRSKISNSLKIDQSLSHNGVCLTVVDQKDGTHTVTAIKETLDRSTLGDLVAGDPVNLERAMPADGRFDGHIVQGHVDQTGTCTKVVSNDGSWTFYFEFEPGSSNHVVVEKGSICIDGISLTVVDAGKNSFSVAIIPYTFENTSFKAYKPGSRVNLEFDIVGKYIAKMMGNYK